MNNTRENLRRATAATNQQNGVGRVARRTSRYKGVSFARKRSKTWRATIRVNRTLLHLGYFALDEDAAQAYNEAAIRYFGEYARPNAIPVQSCESESLSALRKQTRESPS